MKAPNTNPKGLPAYALRPAKGAKLFIKDASEWTEHGADAGFKLRSLTKQRRAEQRAAAASSTNRTAGQYNGAELKPYDGRPGSLDFLALPSLMGSRRVYRADQNKPEASE
jgi:hypothetical protein